MMAHRDRLNALAAAELGRARTAEMGRARPAETQVEVSLTPATKRDGSSPAVRVTVNDVLDERTLRFLYQTILSMTMDKRQKTTGERNLRRSAPASEFRYYLWDAPSS